MERLTDLWEQIAFLVAALAVYFGVVWALPAHNARRRIQRLTQQLAEVDLQLAEAKLQLEIWSGAQIHDDLRALQNQNQQLRGERARLEFKVATLRDRVAELEDEVAATHGVEVDVETGMPG